MLVYEVLCDRQINKETRWHYDDTERTNVIKLTNEDSCEEISQKVLAMMTEIVRLLTQRGNGNLLEGQASSKSSK